MDYTIPTAPIHLYDYWDTAMPYHVADAMQKIKRYTNENKDLRSGLTPEEAQTLCEQAEAIVHFTPENVAVASTLARLLMAQERQQEAIAVADTCTRRYQLKTRVLTDSDYEGYPEEFGRLFKAMKAEGNYFTPGYDGRDNIHAALTYALVCSASGDDSLASQAYRQTQEVITDRMIYQDIRKPRQDHPNYMYQQLMNEKIRLALTSPGNTMGRSDMKDLMETYTYGDAMRVIDQKVKEGKINNARIQQIDTQMGDIEKKCDPYARRNQRRFIAKHSQYLVCICLPYKRCRHSYKEYVCKHLTHLFPRRVSYNRFVELGKEVLLQLTVFIKEVLLGICTGISFVDSTPLRVCRNQRILIHKTFEGLAQRGKCSMR